MCRCRKNKSKPRLHANIAVGLIKKPKCLNYEPNSAYKLYTGHALKWILLWGHNLFLDVIF